MKSLIAGLVGVVVAIAMSYSSVLPIARAADISGAIVEIKEFSSVSGDLSYDTQGSGVIISNDGLVLTNYHIFDVKSENDSVINDRAYQVCVALQADAVPTCEYVASVVAFDKSTDVALIKIKPLATSYSAAPDVSSLSFVNLAAGTIDTGKNITVFGYPGIGGKTLTITKGTISGKESINGRDWLKTDAVVSYGSSGGAVLDENNNLAGLVTETSSDGNASLGLALAVSSLRDWISNHTADLPQEGRLLAQITDLTRKQMILDFVDTYHNKDQSFFITRPSNWTYTVSGENSVIIQNPNSNESIPIVVSNVKLPYRASRTAAPALLRLYMQNVGIFTIGNYLVNKPVSINGYQGTQLEFGKTNSKVVAYAFPVDDNYIFIIYPDISSYGSAETKSELAGIINSVSFKTNNLPVKENRSINSADPKIKLSVGNDWVIDATDIAASYADIFNKKNVEAIGTMFLDQSDLPIKSSNQKFLDKYKSDLANSAASLKSANIKVDLGKSQAKVTLNPAIKNAMRQDFVVRTYDKNAVISYATTYLVPLGDNNYLIFELNVYTSNKKIYDQALASFNQSLKSLRVK